MTFIEWDNALADLAIELDEAVKRLSFQMIFSKNILEMKAKDYLNLLKV